LNQAATSDSPLWYAVYTKPKEEERAETNLRVWGLKTFMPKIKELEYSRRSVKLRTAIKKSLSSLRLRIRITLWFSFRQLVIRDA
jgi:hypothetical protein